MSKAAVDTSKRDTVMKMGNAGFVHLGIVMVPILIENTARINDNLEKLLFQRKALALQYFVEEDDSKKDAILELFNAVSDNILKLIGF